MGRILGGRRSQAPARSSRSSSQSRPAARPAQAQQARQSTGARPAAQTNAAKPATSTQAPARSQAAAPKDQAQLSKPDAKGSTPDTQASAKNVTEGLNKTFNNLWDMGSKAVKEVTGENRVKLSDAERQQVMKASGVLDRLAGADGMWNHGDRGNNVSQLEKSGDLSRAVNQEIGRQVAERKSGKGPLRRGLIDMHMNRNGGKYHSQGMQQARGMAGSQLQAGLDGAGVKRTAGHDAARAEKAGPSAAQNAGKPISRAEMEQFQKTMDMLKARSAAQKLPNVSFPNGIPVGFLHAIGENRSPGLSLLGAGAEIGK